MTEPDTAVIAAHKLARDRFEAFATNDGESVDEITDDMQLQLMRWQRDRFGVQIETHDLRMALGVIEECGETFEADTAMLACDGLGDVCVYAGQLALANRLALSPIIALADLIMKRGPAIQQVVTGRLAHAVLKGSQGIRGFEDRRVYTLALVENLAECIACATETVQINHIAEYVNIAEVYRIVGTEVLKRKRGDSMIPTSGAVADAIVKAESVAELDQAATGAITAEMRGAATVRLARGVDALADAERLEGPGDFVYCPGSKSGDTRGAERDVRGCPECSATFTGKEIAANLGYIPPHAAESPPGAPHNYSDDHDLARIVGDAPGGLPFDTGGDS